MTGPWGLGTVGEGPLFRGEGGGSGEGEMRPGAGGCPGALCPDLGKRGHGVDLGAGGGEGTVLFWRQSRQPGRVPPRALQRHHRLLTSVLAPCTELEPVRTCYMTRT